YKVGQVQEISYLENRGNLEITFDVQKTIPVPKDSRVIIKSADLMGIGGMQLLLLPGQSSQMADNGAMLRDSVDKGPLGTLTSKITEVADMTTKVEKNIDQLLTTFNTAFGEGSDSQLGRIVQNIEAVSGSLSDDSKKLSPILDDFKHITTNIAHVVDSIKKDDKLIRIVDNAAVMSESLKETSQKSVKLMADANNAINKVDAIVADIKAGKGTAGKLINDDQLYNDLNEAVVDLDLLLEDLRQNPKRYVHFSVFGRKNKGPEPPKSINAENTNRDTSNDED
ncbi:MAG: MlaD family protein, partial [Bacteroidota bacterium]